jgi:hypothetical protein
LFILLASERVNPYFTQEKFNVWVAMLNLEYKYGSKESLETLFLQALKETKVINAYSEKEIHLMLSFRESNSI